MPVQLFDDGELRDVRTILRDLGAEYIDVPLDPSEPSSALESGGLVISTRSGLQAAADLCAATPDRVFIEILQHDSPMTDAVSEARCDFIVRRPVHA